MSSTPLSDRAKKRLKIVAGLMRGTGKNAKVLSVSRTDFYNEIQAIIAALPEDEKQELKAHTDWIEAYNNASLLSPSSES